jgi:hypothetical protein
LAMAVHRSWPCFPLKASHGSPPDLITLANCPGPVTMNDHIVTRDQLCERVQGVS